MPVNKKYISVEFNVLKLKERNRELSILFEMSNFLSTSMDLEDLLSGALKMVLDYFNLQAGRIYLLDDSGQYLNLIAHQGMEPAGLERVNISEGFSGKSVRTKSFIAQHVTELEDRKRADLLSAKGFQIIICVPLINENEVKGVMNLAANKMFKLDHNMIDLLTTLANQIAVTANNARLYEDLNNKMEALKEKNDLIKFFAYSISHDLKSPAIGIYGLTKRLYEKYKDALDEKGREYCNQILKSSEQMVALVERINAYVAAKESSLNLEKFHYKEITKMIRDEFSAILKQRQIRWSEPDILPEIIADKISLSRVLRNLVDNALKYGGDKLKEIRIGYEETGLFHTFSFSDDGVGINQEDQDKLFELFQRNNTSSGTDGSGLGLAIVKETAERHGGRAWVETNSNKGTTFHISILKDINING